jgi:hypothetical protein
LCGIEVDNITGVAGDLVFKSLQTNYSKKQNSKFPHFVFKIYNQLLSLVKFLVYALKEMEDGYSIQYLVRNPKENVSVQRHKHVWDDNVEMNLKCI